ncbi:MAG: hypothetical protein ABI671_00300 [Burkholderiales bacterium]
MPRLALNALLLASALLAGCDVVVGALGIESPEKVAALREADGKAIGGACRHAGRAIEDCYVLNKKADKASVFAGWRDMNDYMRENKIEPVAPQLGPTQVANAKAAAADDEPVKDTEKPAPKAAEGGKPGKHGSAKPHDS